jgi:hypothetical protein
MNFKQCALSRPHASSQRIRLRQMAWIPEQFAKVGMVLEIKGSDGAWQDAWVVDDVYTQATEEYVRQHERDYLTQSQASDKFTPNKGLFKKEGEG